MSVLAPVPPWVRADPAPPDSPRPSPRNRPPLSWADGLSLALLTGVTSLIVWARRGLSGQLAEDAAMLLRYSQHVAAGHGIVWNVGQAPVDGATDFLTMLMVAALHVCGVGLAPAIRVLDLVATAGSVGLVYLVARRVHRVGRGLACLASALFVVGPAAIYSRLGFGAPVFAFTVALAAGAAYWFRASPGPVRAAATGGAFLVEALTRPEGLLVALLLATGLLVTGSREDNATLISGLARWFVLPGAAYLVWRWTYFGYPLPNPYYKKGGGHLYLGSLRDAVSVVGSWMLLLPAAYLVPLLDWRRTWRTVAMAAVPVVGFTGSWLLLSPETNYAARFQYPVLALIAVTLPDVVTSCRRVMKRVPRLTHRGAALVAGLLAVSALLGTARYALQKGTTGAYLDDTVTAVSDEGLGKALAPFAAEGMAIATTEAGLVPLVSDWSALDAWGLNDQHIAHHGLDPRYLDQVNPMVVYAHIYPGLDPGGLRVAGLGPAWAQMTRTLIAWVSEHGFVAVRRWGSPDDQFVVWVDPSRRGALRIMNAIRAADLGPGATAVADGSRDRAGAALTPAEARKT